MVLAAQAVKEGQADAIFSAGNTGALLAAGLFIVGRIKGIERPGLIVDDACTWERNWLLICWI